MIKGKTIIRRDVFDKIRGKKIGSIEANRFISASENIFQWLHLTSGGWVSAGPLQRYIKWEVVPDSVDSSNPPTVPDPIIPPPPGTESSEIIKGKTLTQRDVFNKPRGNVKIGSLDADAEIIASEHVLQWLHLANGGWVSAGARQQYIKWWTVSDVTELPPVSDPIESPEPIPEPVPPPPDSDPGPVSSSDPYDAVVTSAPPVEPWPITEIKRRGRIATLLVDWHNPKWDYQPRQILSGQYFAHPQTVTFNINSAYGKGPTIPLQRAMLEYLVRLNGEKAKELILTPRSGWVNIPTPPGNVERLSWAGNHVVVKETIVEKNVEFANVYALNYNETELIGDFFDKDMRLVLHKFNAVTRASKMIKLANNRDCYTPLITVPELNNGDMWIPSEYLEYWPELPFTLSDGTQIIEYELFGHEIYGLRDDGKSVLLRDQSGFKTNWQLNSPEVPI